MSKSYEVFEHTADIGIQAYGRTLDELFIAAAQGVESVMVEPEQIKCITSREVDVEGHDRLSLLISWLNELIFLFDTEYLLFSTFEIATMTDIRLSGRAYGEIYDRERHDLGSAVKAVTWHEAAISKHEDGYRARLILDL